ncbi:MAG: hypothetical protein ACRDMX_18375, partial [Solirubrobacteraceae bacterium]
PVTERPPPASAPPAPVASGRVARPSAPGPRSWPEQAAGEALWVAALRDEIHRSTAGSLSLLLAELEDADRVTAIETRSQATTTFACFASALRGALRSHDILVRESEARAWIIARGTSRADARALGERISDAVRGAPPWRGAPLAASVGVAVLGEDGGTTAELIDAAEEARFEAVARGHGVGEHRPQDAG